VPARSLLADVTISANSAIRELAEIEADQSPHTWRDADGTEHRRRDKSVVVALVSGTARHMLCVHCLCAASELPPNPNTAPASRSLPARCRSVLQGCDPLKAGSCDIVISQIEPVAAKPAFCNVTRSPSRAATGYGFRYEPAHASHAAALLDRRNWWTPAPSSAGKRPEACVHTDLPPVQLCELSAASSPANPLASGLTDPPVMTSKCFPPTPPPPMSAPLDVKNLMPTPVRLFDVIDNVSASVAPPPIPAPNAERSGINPVLQDANRTTATEGTIVYQTLPFRGVKCRVINSAAVVSAQDG